MRPWRSIRTPRPIWSNAFANCARAKPIVVSQEDTVITVHYEDGKVSKDLTFLTSPDFTKLVINTGGGNDSVFLNQEDENLDFNNDDGYDGADAVYINTGAGNDIVDALGGDIYAHVDAGAPGGLATNSS